MNTRDNVRTGAMLGRVTVFTEASTGTLGGVPFVAEFAEFLAGLHERLARDSV